MMGGTGEWLVMGGLGKWVGGDGRVVMGGTDWVGGRYWLGGWVSGW